jgi:outer membrane protein assembly factor BamB
VVVVAILGTVVVVAGGSDNEGDEGDGRAEPDGILAWVRPGPPDESGLVVAGDTVCSTSGTELFCVEAATGEDVFSEQLPAPATAPTLAGDTLVVGADGGAGHGDLYGYSLDGRRLWEAAELQVLDVDEDVSVLRPRLPAAGNVVAVPTGSIVDTELVGVDARSGRELWRTPNTGHIGPVLSDGDRFYLFTLSPRPASVTAEDLRNLDPADPTDAEILVILEQYAAVDATEPLDPQDPEDLQFMLDIGLLELVNAELSNRVAPAVVALDPASGGELWRSEVGAGGTSTELSAALEEELDSPFALDSVVSIGDGGAVAVVLGGEPPQLVVLDVATGARRWDLPLAGRSAAVTYAEGTTIVVDGTDMRGLAPDGTERWRVATPGRRAEPGEDPFAPGLAVEEGRVYAFRSGLFAVDPADGDTRMLRRGLVEDVAVADDHLVVASAGLEAVRLPD